MLWRQVACLAVVPGMTDLDALVVSDGAALGRVVDVAANRVGHPLTRGVDVVDGVQTDGKTGLHQDLRRRARQGLAGDDGVCHAVAELVGVSGQDSFGAVDHVGILSRWV